MAPVARRRQTTHIWCPRCKRKVLQMSDDGRVKIRTKIVVFSKSFDSATVVCQSCGADVPVDLAIGQTTVADLRAPRLIVRAPGRKEATRVK